MSDFTQIEKNAAARAAKSHSVDEVLKAVQIIAAAADRREDLAKLEAASYDKRSDFWPWIHRKFQAFGSAVSPNLPSVAAAVTAIALLVQAFVAGQQWNTQKQATAVQLNSQEDSQWRQAMQQVTFATPDEALKGAFEMQSFFDSARYGEHARSIASTLLPKVDEPSGFDVVLFDLQRRVGALTHQDRPGLSAETVTTTAGVNTEIENDLIGVARLVGSSALDLCQKVNQSDCVANAVRPHVFESFVTGPDKFIRDPDSSDLKLAWARSWEIDSAGHSLAYLWSGPGKQMDANDANIAGVILAGVNLSGANFSRANLQGTFFWGSDVTRADFSQVARFDQSDWNGTSWWEAKVVSCRLANYLKTKFPPDRSRNSDVSSADKLVQSCQPVTPQVSPPAAK